MFNAKIIKSSQMRIVMAKKVKRKDNIFYIKKDNQYLLSTNSNIFFKNDL